MATYRVKINDKIEFQALIHADAKAAVIDLQMKLVERDPTHYIRVNFNRDAKVNEFFVYHHSGVDLITLEQE